MRPSILRRHINHLCVILRSTNVNKTDRRSSIQTVTNSSSSPVMCCQSFHTSLRLKTQNNDNNSNTKKNNNDRILTEKEKLEIAAEDAAKSLPGDWTRIADELMARLNVQIESQSDVDERNQSTVKSSLLSTMKVGRNFERIKSRPVDQGQRQGRIGDKVMLRKRLARRTESFTSLYSQPRLGIFDAEKMKAEAGKTEEICDGTNLWHVIEKEKMEIGKGGVPRNGFEEMIQWTNEGRMWSFPIDNEQDMHEERQYQFHEHVFLDQHLGDFPSDGPIRRFMDLVLIGLSNNPWISVPEKIEHIRWYANYFRDKQQLLEASMGEKAKMKK